MMTILLESKQMQRLLHKQIMILSSIKQLVDCCKINNTGLIIISIAQVPETHFMISLN